MRSRHKMKEREEENQEQMVVAIERMPWQRTNKQKFVYYDVTLVRLWILILCPAMVIYLCEKYDCKSWCAYGVCIISSLLAIFRVPNMNGIRFHSSSSSFAVCICCCWYTVSWSQLGLWTSTFHFQTDYLFHVNAIMFRILYVSPIKCPAGNHTSHRRCRTHRRENTHLMFHFYSFDFNDLVKIEFVHVESGR